MGEGDKNWVRVINLMSSRDWKEKRGAFEWYFQLLEFARNGICEGAHEEVVVVVADTGGAVNDVDNICEFDVRHGDVAQLSEVEVVAVVILGGSYASATRTHKCLEQIA